MPIDRYDRLFAGPLPSAPPSGTDQRTRAQKDRDRVLHCYAFRRLAGVTQVADPGEGHVFHNRLTHVLKVAQVGRRLAEKLNREQASEAEKLGGLDPDVVETAALVHDIGHPPFGHVGERVLDQSLEKEKITDGFEGNPQSFRIVTKLVARKEGQRGLDLTRATLNATLKYPWFRATSGDRKKKWGSYHSDKEAFNFARELCPNDDRKSLEAEIMDWSDDVAYAVHDMEDFYRAGLIPLERLSRLDDERSYFLERAFARWDREELYKGYSKTEMKEVAEKLFRILVARGVFQGTVYERQQLRAITSTLIGIYVDAIRVNSAAVADHSQPRVEIDSTNQMEIRLLKELTWVYVIGKPSLATQLYGKAKIIEDLFAAYRNAVFGKEWASILPERCRSELLALDELGLGADDDRTERFRVVVDHISGMTDGEAVRVHHRIFGIDPGSLIEMIL